MSPEQATASVVDPRSDQYSLGCVLYEMLAGEPPFTGPTPRAIIARRLAGPAPPVRTVRPDVPVELDAALQRALAQVPAARFASIREFAEHLTTPFSRSRPRWRGFAIASAVGAAAVAVALGVWLSRSRPPATLDPDVLAIAPFDVLAPGLDLWREGLVDLLSRQLDGAGPLRTVSPTTIARRASDKANRSSAERLARSTGAGLAVYGAILGAGPDSVRLTATVLDVGRDQIVSETELRGSADRIDQLADSVALRILRDLGRSRPIGAARGDRNRVAVAAGAPRLSPRRAALPAHRVELGSRQL